MIAFLCTSAALDLICYMCPKVSLALLHLECLQAVLETIFLPRQENAALVICSRFVAIGLFFGVLPLQSIIATTVGASVTLTLSSVLEESDGPHLSSSLMATLVVLVTVTANFM